MSCAPSASTPSCLSASRSSWASIRPLPSASKRAKAMRMFSSMGARWPPPARLPPVAVRVGLPLLYARTSATSFANSARSRRASALLVSYRESTARACSAVASIPKYLRAALSSDASMSPEPSVSKATKASRTFGSMPASPPPFPPPPLPNRWRSRTSLSNSNRSSVPVRLLLS